MKINNKIISTILSLLVLFILVSCKPQDKNSSPVVVIQTKSIINEQVNAKLDGQKSYDPDGEIVKYYWNQIEGDPVAISSADRSVATFTSPVLLTKQVLTFTLTIEDNDGATTTNTVKIVVLPVNNLPLVNAGDDLQVYEYENIELQGEATDSDGVIKEVNWKQVSGPEIVIQKSKYLGISFFAPKNIVDEDIQLELTVTDNEGGIAKDLISIQVNNIYSAPISPIYDNRSDLSGVSFIETIDLYENPLLDFLIVSQNEQNGSIVSIKENEGELKFEKSQLLHDFGTIKVTKLKSVNFNRDLFQDIIIFTDKGIYLIEEQAGSQFSSPIHLSENWDLSKKINYNSLTQPNETLEFINLDEAEKGFLVWTAKISESNSALMVAPLVEFNRFSEPSIITSGYSDQYVSAGISDISFSDINLDGNTDVSFTKYEYKFGEFKELFWFDFSNSQLHSLNQLSDFYDQFERAEFKKLGHIEFIDHDHDGDLDIFAVSSNFGGLVWENINGVYETYSITDLSPELGYRYYDDIDGDGVKDYIFLNFGVVEWQKKQQQKFIQEKNYLN